MALLAAIFSPMSAAQRPGSTFLAWGHSPQVIPSPQTLPRAIPAPGGFRHFRTGVVAYPFFYADYGVESEALPPASPIAVEKKVFQPEPKPEPVLIEWRGDRFVRYGGAQTGAQSPDYAQRLSATRERPGSEARQEDPPAVLIYRDGHREQVSDYVITGGVLYARNGYSQDGSWMRNIHLSALDLSATLKANHDGGVTFVLPAGPNEVVTRP